MIPDTDTRILTDEEIIQVVEVLNDIDEEEDEVVQVSEAIELDF